MNHSLGHTVLILGIYVLAAARITRLINADMILEPLRMPLAVRAEKAKAAADEAEHAGQLTRAEAYRTSTSRWLSAYEFATCPWCIGFWVSLAGAAIVVPIVLGWHWLVVIPVALAASHLIGVCARFSSDD